MNGLMLKTFIVCMGVIIADTMIELLERWWSPRAAHMNAVPLSRVGARLVFKALLASAIFFILELALGLAI